VDVREVDVTDLAAVLGEGAPVVDVREPQEYAEAHIAGARNIPLGEIEGRVSELAAIAPVYLVCGVGARSHAAAEALVRVGVPAVNVAGGMHAWMTAGHPVEPGTER
jgi:rhodanese-related sulfurtransferase